MKAVIFAGGQGTRLRPITNTKPKPMVEVGGEPILHWQIEWLRSHGIKSYVILASYLKEVMVDYLGDGKKFGIDVQFPEEREPLGTGGALMNAKPFLKGEKEFMVLNGDILTSMDISRLIKREYVATISLVPFKSPYGIVYATGSKVDRFEEKPVLKEYWVNAGIYYATSRIFDHLPKKGDISSFTFHNLAGEGKLGGEKFSDCRWFTVDSMKDLEEANKAFEAGELGKRPS